MNYIIQGSEVPVESPMFSTGFEGFEAGKYNWIDSPAVRARPKKSSMDTMMLSYMMFIGEENRKELKKMMLEMAYGGELTPEQMMDRYFRNLKGGKRNGEA